MSGVVVVITMPAGHVAAVGADFDDSSPAGYTLVDAQEQRARKNAWHTVMREFCHSDIAAAICDHGGLALDRVTKRLHVTGWKEHVKRVGDPGTDAP